MGPRKRTARYDAADTKRHKDAQTAQKTSVAGKIENYESRFSLQAATSWFNSYKGMSLDRECAAVGHCARQCCVDGYRRSAPHMYVIFLYRLPCRSWLLDTHMLECAARKETRTKGALWQLSRAREREWITELSDILASGDGIPSVI